MAMTMAAAETSSLADTLTGGVTALAEEAESIADRLDEECRLPEPIYAGAAQLGLFRQLVPESAGGRGDAPLMWFRRGLEMARFEPSLAWVVTQGAAELGWIAAGGDPEWSTQVLADPLAASASTIAGLGSLTVRGSAATLNGSWSFNTGCQGATWIGGLALADGDGVKPGLRMCWVPADRATIVEDWDATGLRGTGSHGIAIVNQEVRTSWTVAIFEPTDHDRGPYTCLVGNGNWPIATAVAATQLGNARRAVDEVRRLVLTKAPAPAFVPLAQNSAVLRDVAELEGLWLGAVAAVEQELALMWEEAITVGALSAGQRWRLAAANANGNRVAVRIVDRACELAGTTVAARRNKLSRCLRDAHTLQGHIATNGTVLERIAQVSLGLVEPDMLV
jgi:alkylation response protein AidB-like acyl-CoA dehydrogenase